MDDRAQLIQHFENILKKNNKKTPLSLYSKNTNKKAYACTAQDIISSVNHQIKAIQKADNATSCKVDRKKLEDYKKSTFIPINMLPRENEVTNQKPVSRFETQCVSDTQLIDIIENAEAIANSNNGITQEFDSTFCHMEESKKDTVKNEYSSNKSTPIVQNTNEKEISKLNTEIIELSSTSKPEDAIDELVNTEDATNSQIESISTKTQKQMFEKFTDSNDEITTDINKEVSESSTQMYDKDNSNKNNTSIRTKYINNMSIDEIINPSPVFQVPKSKTPSPLVFDLNTFESFENIALPIIEESADLPSAKQLINSQIIGKELIIETGVKCNTSVNNEQTSPILKVNAERLKITKRPAVAIEQIASDSKNNSDLQHGMESNNTFLNDEILFSSDEEEEYVHMELQDIPLTCALETSFYEQPHILDKTMYVGFQTASNRSIQITTDSFSKAKSLLDAIEKDIASSKSLTELVDVLSSKNDIANDNNTITDTNTKESSIDTEKRLDFKNQNNSTIFQPSISENNNSVEQKCETIERPEKRKFDGFMTASNKKIKLSDMALARCKRVFQDIDLADDFNNTDSKNNDNKIEEENPSHIDDDILHEFSRDMSLIDERNNELDKELAGFKTASNKDIKISEAALAKTKQIFEDINIAAISKEFVDSKIAIKRSKDGFSDIDVAYNLSGDFIRSVANKVSCKTLKDVKISDVISAVPTNVSNIIDDTESFDKEIVLSTSKFCGFKTASNKDIKISDMALEKGNIILKDIISDCNVESTLYKDFKRKDVENFKDTHGFSGFKTANNKVTQISEQALLKSKELFKDIPQEVGEIVKEGQLNVTNSTKKKSGDMKETIEKMSRYSNTVVNNETVDIEIERQSFNGFKTANNKPISISAKALKEGKKLFSDLELDNLYENEKIIKLEEFKVINEIDDEDKEIIPFRGFETISSESTVVNKNISEDLKHKDDGDLDAINKDTDFKRPKDGLHVFKGFQTANNKHISISSEALLASKALFKDLDCENSDVINKTDDHIPTARGFQMASNKHISISSEALAQSKLLFKNIDNENVENESKKESSDNIATFKGFQTASKKPVSVSAEALARSKLIFKDIDQDVSDNYVTDQVPLEHKTEIPISAQTSVNSIKAFDPLKDDAFVLKNKLNHFQGFQTASNKAVMVSEDAFLKSKKLFEDIDGLKEKTSIENKINSNQFTGFHTASNKKVNISEKALKRTRQIFQDIDLSDNTKENNTAEDSTLKISSQFGLTNTTTPGRSLWNSNQVLKDTQDNCLLIDNSVSKDTKQAKLRDSNLETLIDTQIINNFEETVYTEDFCKDITPRQSKRSGSPILSCPKAKKRKKFETPYRNDGRTTPFTRDLKEHCVKPDTIIIYNSDYKKNKRFKLKDLAKVEEKGKTRKIDPYILNYNLDTFLDFQFSEQRNDLSSGRLTTEDLKDFFQKTVDKKLIPIGWMENHLKLIIWKLISYEIKFPHTLYGVCTVKNVLEQLKHRYDRELYYAERPALRKVLEKDDVASKTMVLCVAGIFIDGVSVKSVTNLSSDVELLLTDGWYLVKACIDKMLIKLVYDGKIMIGSKLAINGAELINCEQGVSPWEDTSSVRLKISGNSTRRARWDARLGYHGNAAMLTRLSSVKPEGGKVSKLRLYVARAYPMLYVEKFKDGSTVTRSERLEHIHQVKYESERQTAMEKLYEEVEKELSDQESQDSLGSQLGAKHTITSTDFRITESQAKSLEERSNRKRERLLQNVQERVRKKIEDRGIDFGRNVVPLLKIRVAGIDTNDANVTVTKGLMSIWKPNDLLTDIIKEGTWIEVMNVVPTAIRYSEIHLSAGRQSIFSNSKYKEDERMKPSSQSLRRKCYHIKELAQNPTMATDYNEIDTLGLIFQIDEESNQPFQNIYLTDSEKHMICVNFWGGLKKFGFQNVLEVGQVIYCMNLQKRAGNTRKSIPHFRVTEFTYFTKTPKNSAVRTLISELEKEISCLDKTKYIEECKMLKNNYSNKSVTDNVSPYRFYNDHSLIKNRVFIDSPLAAKSEENYNLTGLDFESTFKQMDTQDLSPKALQRKRMVRQKIAKLKMIGEPPPLSPLNIINRSKNASKSYKSPLVETIAKNRQSYQNSRIDQDIQSSPVIQTNANISYERNVKENEENTSINEDIPSSPLILLNVNSAKKAYRSMTSDVKTSQLMRVNVSNVQKCCQNSRISDEEVQSSPVFSMNRTYVKNVVPVKLNFSNVKDNSLEEEVDHFAEEFDGSPPLSLD